MSTACLGNVTPQTLSRVLVCDGEQAVSVVAGVGMACTLKLESRGGSQWKGDRDAARLVAIADKIQAALGRRGGARLAVVDAVGQLLVSQPLAKKVEPG